MRKHKASHEPPTKRDGFLFGDRMKKLQEKINKNGYIYTQLQRCDKCALYEQKDKSGNTIAFEVFLVRVNKARVFNGKEIEESEAFPYDEAFGKWAWTYKNLSDAIIKYNSISDVSAV